VWLEGLQFLVVSILVASLNKSTKTAAWVAHLRDSLRKGTSRLGEDTIANVLGVTHIMILQLKEHFFARYINEI
jgi:hypothetical protein